MTEQAIAERQLLTPNQVRDQYGPAEQTLAVWRRKGLGPCFIRLESGRIRYRRSDIEAWLSSQTIDPSAA